jgi:predicted GH43/DUF377 family glycosyl hydrolase
VSANERALLRLTPVRLTPDSRRVVTRLFVAGQEDFGSTETRTSKVLDRVLAFTEEEVVAALDEVCNRFGHRHADLVHLIEANAQRVANHVLPGVLLSDERRRLIGAAFTHEFSTEGASLTNPSAVPHPDQSDLPDGAMRFVMSVRGIGEGHRSSIGFRTGILTAEGDVSIDAPGRTLSTGSPTSSYLGREHFEGMLSEIGDLGENSQWVLSHLGDRFTVEEMHRVLTMMLLDRDSFRNSESTVHNFRTIAERNYSVTFPRDHPISDRVLWPYSAAEWRGMEDARFVRLIDDDGSARYHASYTAFDGVNISMQLLSTDDFQQFSSRPMSGKAAKGKGMAFFPRRVGGMYAAMTRSDHESNSISFSDDIGHWEVEETVQVSRKPWEVIQLGNSGSPVETEAGWLLLTHAVGPMRTYTISASLLDLEDPARVIGTLDAPLLAAGEDVRDGYVPNVVYSCGAVVHGATLMLPFGIADQSIGIAVVDLDGLVARLAG